MNKKLAEVIERQRKEAFAVYFANQQPVPTPVKQRSPVDAEALRFTMAVRLHICKTQCDSYGGNLVQGMFHCKAKGESPTCGQCRELLVAESGCVKGNWKRLEDDMKQFAATFRAERKDKLSPWVVTFIDTSRSSPDFLSRNEWVRVSDTVQVMAVPTASLNESPTLPDPPATE